MRAHSKSELAEEEVVSLMINRWRVMQSEEQSKNEGKLNRASEKCRTSLNLPSCMQQLHQKERKREVFFLIKLPKLDGKNVSRHLRILNKVNRKRSTRKQ